MMILSLPGLAALAALLFTWMQVGQTSKELRISEQGQITSRFNAAIGNLGSDSIDVRLGGIYALERIMRDSARDHPAVIAVLSAYVRRHAPVTAAATSAKEPPVADVYAAMSVLAGRNASRDRELVIDLSRTDLSGWKPASPRRASFPGALLEGADLRDADLSASDLREALLTKSDMSGAWLDSASLRSAWMEGINLRQAHLAEADLRAVHLFDADLRGASLMGLT